jgi:hypothetical protein
MPADRFRFIEGPKEGLPDELKKSLGNLGRFGSIELPGQTHAVVPKTKRECPGCQAPIADDAVECPACRRVLEPEPKIVPRGADLAIVLDGQTYASTDKNLPDDISELIGRIRAKGYTPALVAEWRSWRATRRSAKARAPDPAVPVPVLRINGRLLRWSDAELPDDLRVLFAFIATKGVSPALLAHLKEIGHDVSYDPDAEGGVGLLELRTDESPFRLTPLQKQIARACAAGLVAWLFLRPFRNVLPGLLEPALYVIPAGFFVAWAFRR